MKRALRRVWRQWKGELQSHWRRLSSFMRIVVGISVAVLMVLALRSYRIDTMQAHWETLREANAAIDLPLAALNPETDSEIEAARMRIENIEPSLQEARDAVAALTQRPDVLSPARRGEALNVLDEWIGEAGLVLHSRVDLRDDAPAHPGPVPVSRHRYVVTGPFPRIHTFIRRLRAFPYVSRFDEMDLVVRADSMPTASVSLQLTFDCTLYLRP
jgi:hypothetical protein